MASEKMEKDDIREEINQSYESETERSFEESFTGLSNVDNSLVLSHHLKNTSLSINEKSYNEKDRRKESFVSITAFKKDKFSTTENFIQSSVRLIQSNTFSFVSASYAVAKLKELELSQTLSLMHQHSTDRKTPSLIYFFNVLSMITSLAVFAMPYFIAHLGLATVGIILVTGCLSAYTAVLINRCQYQTSKNGQHKRVYTSFVDMGEATIKWKGGVIMQIVLGSNIMTDIYMLVFCAQVALDLFRNILALDIRLWILIWTACSFPLFMVRRMSILAWFSFIALALYICGFGICIAVLIKQYDKWSFRNINGSFKVQNFFIGYGLILNSFNIHLACPALEASMKNPKRNNIITPSAIGVNMIVKCVFAMLGAAPFGLLTKGSILSNLESNGMAVAAKALIGFSLLLVLPTSVFVVLNMVDSTIQPNATKTVRWKRGMWLVGSRLLICILLAGFATCVPKFEVITSFVGNIRGTLTLVVLPVYFYLQIKKRHLSIASKVLHSILIIVAIVFGVTGAVYSLLEITK